MQETKRLEFREIFKAPGAGNDQRNSEEDRAEKDQRGTGLAHRTECKAASDFHEHGENSERSEQAKPFVPLPAGEKKIRTGLQDFAIFGSDGRKQVPRDAEEKCRRSGGGWLLAKLNEEKAGDIGGGEDCHQRMDCGGEDDPENRGNVAFFENTGDSEDGAWSGERSRGEVRVNEDERGARHGEREQTGN